MARAEAERQRLLVRVSKMYYTDGLTQAEIATAVGTSRPAVSRLLSEAQKVGIVRIQIYDPFTTQTELEQRMASTFNLREASIVPADVGDVGLYEKAAGVLERLIPDGASVGVNAGNTLSGVCESVRSAPKPNSTVIPLVGGWGPSGSTWQANLSARALAERLSCPYLQLNAPAFVSSMEMRDALIAETEVSSVLARGRLAEVTLIGIGQVSPGSTLATAGFLDEAQLAELTELGAVANVCNTFIDRSGAPVAFSGYDRMVGLSIQELNRATSVVAVASGPAKVKAITAALNGGWLHYLVTDEPTAHAVLASSS